MSEEQPTGQHEAIKAHFDTRIISGLYAQRHQFFNTQPEALQAQETIVDVLRRELYKPEGNETNLLELGCYVGYNTERLLLSDPYYQDPERTVNLTGIDLSSLALAEYKNKLSASSPNLRITTINASIEEGVNNIDSSLDNVYSTGVFQMSSEELSHALTTLTPLLSTQGTFIFEFIPTSGQTVRGKRSRVGNYDSFYFPKKYLKKMIAEIAKTQGLKLKVKFIDVPGYHVPASETDFSGINMMWSSPTALCIVKKL